VSEGETVIYVAASLDGYIADRECGVKWLDAYNSKDFKFEEFFEKIDAIVMGRATYDQVIEMDVPWPYGARRCVVLSRRDLPAAGPCHVERHSGGIEPLITDLRKENKRIWIVGGGEVFKAFLKTGAVDELNLFVLPILLGDGVKLFPPQDSGGALELLSATPFENGVVRLDYTKENESATA